MDTDTILGLDKGLFFEEFGLLVTAIAAVVGIWIDRDEERPRSYSTWLTVLVVLATGVGVVQAYSGFLNETKLRGDIARILQKIDKIAHQGKADVPALNEVLKKEVTVQSRSNPDVLAQMAQRVADEGGDPKAVSRRI
jgi:enamine deaminase RidA (YjgF/YER057c/UK114 family)